MRINASQSCPCCESDGPAPFYKTPELPSTATPRFRTREEAVNVHRRTCVLVLCPACGLIRGAASGGAVQPPGPHGASRADLAAALLVCRNAFEHVAQPGEFLRRVRRLIDADPEARVVMHLGDAMDALNEGAFWAACRDERSHFTPGSLARVVRASGFDVTELRRDDDDRRFVLEARPAEVMTPMRFDLEDDLAGVTEAAGAFATAAHRQATRWRRIIDDSLADGHRLALWGADAAAVAFLSALQVSDADIPTVVDIDPKAHGHYLAGTGQRIIPPNALAQDPPDVVILLDSAKRAEVMAHLDRLQLRSRVLSP